MLYWLVIDLTFRVLTLLIGVLVIGVITPEGATAIIRPKVSGITFSLYKILYLLIEG